MNPSILPRHIAIIMDGNGRWAKQRRLPRVAGHKAGLEAAHKVVEHCIKQKLEVLTLFVFSSENWRRPEDEVSYLMHLFVTMLQRDANKLHEQNVQLRIIGDRSRFSETLQKHIAKVEKLTESNTGLKLLLAANYGGQWDITEAMRKIATDIRQGSISMDNVTTDTIKKYLSFADLPDPDLFIRTSGEMRISNFMLWQLAYSELYFTDVYWPDFNPSELDKALLFFSSRERRFGYISEQLKEK
jgi:undecaprenyl diphosphate synthase